MVELQRSGARCSATRAVLTVSADDGRRCSPHRLAAQKPRLRCSAIRHRRKTTRVCTWTYMYLVRPSSQPRQCASWPSGQNESAGTAKTATTQLRIVVPTEARPSRVPIMADEQVISLTIERDEKRRVPVNVATPTSAGGRDAGSARSRVGRPGRAPSMAQRQGFARLIAGRVSNSDARLSQAVPRGPVHD